MLIATYFVHRSLGRRVLTVPLAVFGIGVLGVGVFSGDITPWHGLFALLTFVSGGVTVVLSSRVVTRRSRISASPSAGSRYWFWRACSSTASSSARRVRCSSSVPAASNGGWCIRSCSGYWRSEDTCRATSTRHGDRSSDSRSTRRPGPVRVGVARRVGFEGALDSFPAVERRRSRRLRPPSRRVDRYRSRSRPHCPTRTDVAARTHERERRDPPPTAVEPGSRPSNTTAERVIEAV